MLKQIEKFDELNNKDEFENFIAYLKQKGTTVTFVLYPYNPISYNLLIDNKDYVIIRDVEYYLKQFSQKNKIKLLGSYNPHKFNFKSKDFTDGMHGLENVSKIIFEEYKRN